MFGPLKKFWTMHFEHMHQRHKFHADHSRNFINIELLLTTRNQQYQLVQINDRVCPEYQYEKKIQLLESDFYDFNNSIYTFIVKSILYRGIKFSVKNFVVIDASYSTIKMMEIHQILMSEEGTNNCLFHGAEVVFIYDDKTGLYTCSTGVEHTKTYITIKNILYTSQSKF